MVTSRYESMPIQIQLLSTPAAINGKTIFQSTRGVDAPATFPASSNSRWTLDHDAVSRARPVGDPTDHVG